MYPIPPTETLRETRTCRHCQTLFPITDTDMEFYEKVSPIFGGKKYIIPPPTLCPDCRQQRRLSFRNERKLYKRKCDATGKEIISIYSPNTLYTVYHQDYWWSDAWDPLSYGREFDFSRGAFEQFGELMREVPRTALLLPNTNHGTQYAQDTAETKNCYMMVNGYRAENCYYGYAVIFGSTYCTDCEWVIGCQNCYECVYSDNINNGFYCKNCNHSNYIYFCEDCHGCSYCIGCIGLKNKKYHIYNKAYTKEEFNKFFSEDFIMTIRDNMKLSKMISQLPHKNIQNIACEDVYYTNFCKNSKQLVSCFNISHGENCRFGISCGGGIRNSYDFFMVGTPPMERTMETIGTYRTFDGYFLTSCDECRNIYYCDTCYQGNSNLFLCTGLRNKSYCILNKQYTKEEYETLVPKIIEHMMQTPLSEGGRSEATGGNVSEWGEFFPSSLSPFGYNETVAQEYFPLSRESVIPAQVGIQNSEKMDSGINPEGQAQGNSNTFLHGPIFNWSDYEPHFPKVEKIIPASKLPDTIDTIPDDILNWAIECEVTGKPFRIIRQELEFYRKHHIPIPRRHPDQRHQDRMNLRNPRKLFERVCDCPSCEENWKRKKTDTHTDTVTHTDTQWSESFTLNPDTGKRAKKMITTYAPERPETVYCEVCYDQVVWA